MWNAAEVGEMEGAGLPSEAAEVSSETSRKRTKTAGRWKRREIAMDREFLMRE